MLAHGDVVLSFWSNAVFLVFGVPLLFLLIFHKKAFALRCQLSVTLGQQELITAGAELQWES